MTDYRRQRRNANLHTERGMLTLKQSIEADGWIGALSFAADGESFDGSARLDVAPPAEPIIIRSDGTRPIYHIREDIPTADDPRAVRLGVAANRIAQMNLNFDTAMLADMRGTTDLSALWDDDEWAVMLDQPPDIDFKEYGMDAADDVKYCTCPECGHRFPV